MNEKEAKKWMMRPPQQTLLKKIRTQANPRTSNCEQFIYLCFKDDIK